MRRALITTFFALIALTAIVIGLATGGIAAPRAVTGDAATFGSIALPALSPGATVSVAVPVTNIGSTTWTSPAVNLSYHWYTSSGGLVVWDGVRTPLGASIAPGATRTIAAQVVVPTTARSYTLSFELVHEGVAWFGSAVSVPARVVAAVYRASFSVGAGASASAGTTVSLPVTVMNTGTASWSSTDATPIFLAYHLYDATGALVVWDGPRTALGSSVSPGVSRSLTLTVRAPATAGDYVVRVDLVREGVAWFSALGVPNTSVDPGTDIPLRVPGTYGAIDIPDAAYPGAYGVGEVTLTNSTATTWRAAGTNSVHLSYHVYTAGGALEIWDGERSLLPHDIAPGGTATIDATFRAPATGGDHVIAWDLVQEGVAWLSQQGVAPVRVSLFVKTLPSSLVGAEWYRIPTTAHVVVLTFDCGANADGAQKILDTLAAKDVPATFFLCGNFANSFPDVARTIASRYPVGNHTMTHPDLRTLSDADVVNEILAGERTIRAVTGVDAHPLFRFPYGASDARTIALANAYGYGGMRWTVDTLGWEGTSGGQSVATVTSRVLGSLQPGEIVLMHVGSNPDDRSTLDADALAGVIDQIRAAGYGFATLLDYLP